MRCLGFLLTAASFAAARISQNGQWRLDPYPGQAPAIQPSNTTEWRSYPPNATELSYKGRWDSKFISWWTAPGLKFGFTGRNVAITFGEYTSPEVLVAYRVDGLDWRFSNVTANGTYQFVSPTNFGNATGSAAQTFELRVTNYAYGVQIKSILTAMNGTLVKIPNNNLMIEFIGDSLTAGMYSTYEGISGFGFGIGAGLGDAEFSITAYPGICLHDVYCWGNWRGQTHQWLQTSDTSGRAETIWANHTELWDFSKQQAADYVFINLGTNDNNTSGGNVTGPVFYQSYIQLIEEVHTRWPKAQIILMTLWEGFTQVGNSWYQGGAYIKEIPAVVSYFSSGRYAGNDFVHLFNTTGILQHNDINPEFHPTDFGHVKIASHVLQFLKLKFGLELAATGPMVQSGTLYWNTEQDY